MRVEMVPWANPGTSNLNALIAGNYMYYIGLRNAALCDMQRVLVCKVVVG